MKTLAVLGLAALVLGLAPRGASAEEAQREGKVRGTVITVGDESVVIQRGEGGQMTLEARWVQVEGKWTRSKEQIALFHSLKQGDPVAASWRIGDGNHYICFGIEKIGTEGARLAEGARPEGARRAEGGTAVEVQALRAEISGLRQEIAALKVLVTKLLEKK